MILPLATPAMADSEQEAKVQAIAKAALMLRNPSVADVSQPVTITVFGKYNHEPVDGAGVYALKTNELAITADDSDSTIIANYAAIVTEKGKLLGYTGDDGTVNYKFTENGKYMLVAVKSGFTAGFSQITITLSASQGLDVKAPGAAKVGEAITITVSEIFSGQPVEGAAVYARKIKEISLPQVVRQSNVVQAKGIAGIIHPLWEVLQKKVRPNAIAATSDNEAVQSSVEAVETAPEETLKYAADIKGTGIFIGNTDYKGEVSYAFAQSGMYVLIATRDGYAPGFARITVNPGNQDKLGIKAPATANVGKPVTITVIERNTGNPVGGAAVYAVKIDNADGYPLPLESATSADAFGAAEVEKYATVARERGAFIGNTNDSGQLMHTFNETGRYILMTTKDNYMPGFARLTITLAVAKALFIKAPGEANTGQEIPIAVYTRQGYQPVENAAVYAIKWEILSAPMPIENGTATQILKPQPPYTTEAEKYAALAAEEGIFIGYTDGNGQVFHTFDEAGRYTLVVIKDGYTPAFTTINIGQYRVMNLKKPEEAKTAILQSTLGSSNSKKPK